MKHSPTRVPLIILFVFLGCFGVAYGAAGMLTALPAPAIGGTCGPSTASETAFQALAEPGSIGAGAQPPKSNVTAHQQWQTFVQQCQALADRRGLASLAIVVFSISVAGGGLFWALRKRRSEDDEATDDAQLNPPPYTPLGLQDPNALVGAGAMVGAAAPMATWPPAPQPGYGQPVPPPYPGAYPEASYSQPAWPAQPPGYPPPQQPAYPQTPAWPAPPDYPALHTPVPPPAPEAPVTPILPTNDHDGQEPGHGA
jgi:hypothetical protein